MQKTKLYIDALPLAQDKMSGIGHLTLELARALSRDDTIQLTLLLPLWKRKRVEAYKIDNCRIKTIPMPARILATLMRIRLLPPIDLFMGRGVYLFPNYRNWPLMFSTSLTYFHDVSFLLYPDTVSPKNLKYLKRNAKIWLGRTDRILTLTQSSKREIIQTLYEPEVKIKVVPCGVDGSLFLHKSKKEIEESKEKYLIPTDKYLICIGNLEPRKNIDRLIEAYKKLPPKLYDSYNLVLIGAGGWLNEKTMRLIDEANRNKSKIIHPQVYVPDSDLPSLISGASLLVHPAIYEGFGMPPLQAMSCGVPVAASNIDSAREVLEDSALFFDPYSTDDMANVIEAALSDEEKRKELINKGTKRAEKFSWTHAATALTDIIEDVQMRKEH